MDLSKIKKVYLVGIGGVGMSGLALLLKDMGFEVKGSDKTQGPYIRALTKEGIDVFIGHAPEQVTSDIGLVAFSSAVSIDNPEIVEAKRRGIEVLQRGKLLSHISRNKQAIAVAGSHGKTTTSSLLAHGLTGLGYKPTVFLGGVPLNYSRTARWGGEYFVIEADESDGSFLYYQPWASLITNIDHEHLDYYGSFDNLYESFSEFAGKAKEVCIGWGDNPEVRKIIEKNQGLTFGFQQNNTLSASEFAYRNGFSSFKLCAGGKFIGRIEVPLLGRHNCLNTLAVLAFFFHLGCDLLEAAQALRDFKGTKRRLQVKARIEGVTFIDDYAHHPSEISAVIEAVKLLKGRRLLVVFEPHRYSRISRLKDKFKVCFSGADSLVVTDIYRAGENAPQNLSSKNFCAEIAREFSGPIEYMPKSEIPRILPSLFKEGDIVLGLGAGDINTVMEEAISEFENSRVKA